MMRRAAGVLFVLQAVVAAPLAKAQTGAPLSATARQILERDCISCHGAANISGLDLRSREAALKGGSKGPSIQPGNAQSSLLYQAVAHTGTLKMPVGRDRLPAGDIEAL